jgi:1-deoxy-D-xylulose-5-phosphate reductoisomerase
MRRVVIAGVTGSIGQQAVEVLSQIDDIQVVAVGARSDAEGALAAAKTVGAEVCTVEAEVGQIPDADGIDLRAGDGAIVSAIAELEPDLVLNAVVGFAGVAVTRAAIDAGADLALANKESLVAGGQLVTGAISAAGLELIPVDSEHAALAQLLDGAARSEVESVTLTASGGPFRGLASQQLQDVGVADALRHPTWDMGGKITIDSATLMNKGLEVIEAERLFGLSYDEINVVVHPESIVHGLVSFQDGIQTAHLGIPDMRAPIAWALAGRTRPALRLERLDLAKVGQLNFEAPDLEAFACLALAYRAGREGGAGPAVLNAANEVAVDHFLNGRIRFDQIASVVETALDDCSGLPLNDWDDLAAADTAGRAAAEDATVRLTEAPAR